MDGTSFFEEQAWFMWVCGGLCVGYVWVYGGLCVVSRCFTGLKINLVQWFKTLILCCKRGKNHHTNYMTELQIQAECFKWFHNTYISERGMLHHNNNNSINSIAGNKMKSLGVVAGVSDFELILPDGKVAFIEMKTERGILSDDQKRFCAMVVQRGHIYIVARGIEDFKKIVKQLTNV